MGKRKKAYEKKVALKEGTEWDDLMNMAIEKPDHEKRMRATVRVR